MAKGVLNWSKGVKISVKIILMLICCIGLAAAPLLLQNSVISEFALKSGADITIKNAADKVFFTLLRWFAGFLVLMLIINLLFFIVDECRNDLVKWRRRLQVLLNVLRHSCRIINRIYAAKSLLP